MTEQEDDHEDEEREEEDDGEEEEDENLVESVCSDDEMLTYSLYSYDDHEEVAIFDESEGEDGKKGTGCVVIATDITELDEAIEILGELRVKMIEVAKKKGRT